MAAGGRSRRDRTALAAAGDGASGEENANRDRGAAAAGMAGILREKTIVRKPDVTSQAFAGARIAVSESPRHNGIVKILECLARVLAAR